MNRNRVVAMVAAAACAGFIHTLAAQDNVDVTPNQGTSGQNISLEQKPPVETPAPVAMTPAQTFVPPAEKLLSEMKVYPTF
ncbi:MAG: hypothetical protein HY274_00360 [Gammaproteobacteria bacterium]|nr:hypothetical protein [Gammaproteobacteria bacterium]